jgi:hypothetical protein
MTRWWNETMAAIDDRVPIPLLMFLSLIAAALIALAWYFWPAWLPWHWKLRDGGHSGSRGRDGGERGRFRFRFGRLRWRWPRWRRRRRKGEPDPAAELGPDELPDLPAGLLALTADQLAEAGRYAEAVRERLRAIVRGLIERGVIPHSPGWTVTELARAAVGVQPALGSPLDAAVMIFSEIWYGLRPALRADDDAMRTHAAAIERLAVTPAGSPADRPDTAAGSPADRPDTVAGGVR